MIALNREKHGPVREYQVRLRQRLTQRFPDMVFFFEPADITNQILNFGLPAPIDLQVSGRDVPSDYKIAQRLRDRIARIPGAADVHIHEIYRELQLFVNVDRTKAGEMGLTQRDVSSSLLISLSGNNQVAPSFWMNPAKWSYLQRGRADIAHTGWTSLDLAAHAGSPGGNPRGGFQQPAGPAERRRRRGGQQSSAPAGEFGEVSSARLRPSDREPLERVIPGLRHLRQRRSPRLGRKCRARKWKK